MKDRKSHSTHSNMESFLPVEYRTEKPKSVWRIDHVDTKFKAQTAAFLVENPAEIQKEDLLKLGTRRLIFKIQSSGGQAPFVTKSFPLSKFRHRRKHLKYAHAEAANLHIAANRGLPVPCVFAYGLSKFFGLVRWNAVCMEYISGPTLEELLRQHTQESSRLELLDRIINLLKNMFHSGCNHLDVNPGAIVFRNGQLDSPHLLDFQYCRFLDEPNPNVIAIQCGYFGWHLLRDGQAARPTLEAWFTHVLETLEIKPNNSLLELFHAGLIEKKRIEYRIGLGSGAT